MEEKRLRNQGTCFIVMGKELYRKSLHEGSQLRFCISEEEDLRVTKSIQNGGGGAHQGSRKLANQVKSQGYYWPSLHQIAKNIVEKCVECQKYRNIQQAPSTFPSTIKTPIPFARWSLDIVGPLPLASKKKKYILVVVNYFTKKDEAEALSTINCKAVVNFVFRKVICIFGVPMQIITNNGTQFARNEMNFFCQNSEIKASQACITQKQTNKWKQ